MDQPGPGRRMTAKATRKTTPDPNAPGRLCACLQEDASAAIAAIQAQGTQENFLDDSHFRISLWTCRECLQAFLYVMTETIDWSDGDDPVIRVYFPVSPEHAIGIRDVRPQGYSDLAPFALNGPYLVYDWPSAGPAVAAWWTGPFPCFRHD